MNNSPGFALEVLACGLLALLFWSACAGIGWQLLPRPPADDTNDDTGDDTTDGADGAVRSWRQPGLAACVGLAVLLAVAGIGVVLRIPWWVSVAPFLVAGLALGARELNLGYRRTTPSLATVATLGLPVAALLVVAMVDAPVGFRFPLNACDDWRAYLPMAHRLLDTYGLEEAWSARRVQSLGGFDLLRALPVWVFGNSGVGVAEHVFGAVFLGGLLLTTRRVATWRVFLSTALILGIPLLWVPRTNTTGVLIGVPLLVAVYGVTTALRREVADGRTGAAFRWAVAGGLIAAALMSVRPNLSVLAGGVLAIGAICAPGRAYALRAKAVLVAGVASLLALAPWSYAMWRTAGTPLYPLFSGNLNRAAYRRAPLSGTRELFELVWDLLNAGNYLWLAVGVAIVAIVAWRVLPDPLVVVTAAGGSVLVTAIFAGNTPRAPAGTFIRYVAPMATAAAVFLVCEALRSVDGMGKAPVSRASTVGTGLTLAGGLVLVAFGFSTFGLSLPRVPTGPRLLVEAAKNELQPAPGFEVSTPRLRAAYAGAFRDVDPERTIAAVDRPYLIDYSRDDVPHLDSPGYMTPQGGAFSFFAGPADKFRFLRESGYDTLVATDPSEDICLNPARIAAAVSARPNDRRIYRRFLDWGADIEAAGQLSPDAVRRFGPLLVIDLVEAERELRDRT